jgi:hypothetical protein
MEQRMSELLPQCTARISLPGQTRAGTGCFVAPGVLLTCAHVVSAALTGASTSPLEIWWQEQSYPAQVLKLSPEYDLALVHVPLIEHPCVLLQEEVQPHENLCSYGYPDDYPHGDTVTGEFEGLTEDKDTFPLLKFKMGQVRPGMSGAPLCNERTGAVCGIVKRSRDRESDLGGRAIPTRTVVQVFPELLEGQRSYLRSDLGWTQLLHMHPFLAQANRNRQLMLERVRRKWIKGVLEPSLHGAPLIVLGLQEQPALVENPWQVQMQELDQQATPLRASTRLLEAYDEATGALLILGGPGAGKTTLLLDLTADLLVRAERDETDPIPVVFNLSSWAPKCQSLEEWLVEELFIKYQVPRQVGQEWVTHEQLLLLLDGLDEVPAEHRDTCIEAINTYRRAHGFVPLVVSCRSAQYAALQHRLQLENAVMVQPLTSGQIETYLASASDTFAPVRQVIGEDAALRELAATPLMLSILAVTYVERPLDGLVAVKEDTETRRRQIFATYVQQMLHRRGMDPRYSLQQTVRWLVWLAQQLSHHHLTEFYLERMQPDWLPAGRWWQGAYQAGIRLCLAVLCAVLIGIAAFTGKTLQYLYLMNYGPYRGNMLNFGFVIRDPLLWGLGLGLVFGLVGWIRAAIEPAELITWSWTRLQERPENLSMLRNGFISSLIMGSLILLHEITYYIRGPHEPYPLYDAYFYSILYGLCFGLLIGIMSRVLYNLKKAYAVIIPLPRDRLSIVTILLRSLLIGLLVGLGCGLLFWRIGWNGRSVVLGSGFFGMLAGVTYGLSSNVRQTQTVVIPLPMSRRVFTPTVFVSLLAGPITGGAMNVLLYWVVPWWPHSNPLRLPGGPFFIVWVLSSLCCGLAFALLYHAIASIQHISLHRRHLFLGLTFGFFNGFIGILSYWSLLRWCFPQSHAFTGSNLLASMSIGILFGCLGGVLACQFFRPMVEQHGVPASLLFGLPIGLLFGLIVWWTWTEVPLLSRMLVWGSLAWLISSLLLGLAHREVGELPLSWKQVWQFAVTSETLRNMLGVWVITSLLGMRLWTNRPWDLQLRTGLIFGTIGGLSFGFLDTLLGGLSSEQLDEHTLIAPNQGIQRSARNAVQVGLLFGLAIGLFSMLLGGMLYRVEKLTNSLAVALFCLGIMSILGGLLAGLTRGGLACIQHGILRVLLWYRGSTPWHYPRFLDYATERILLRKLDGGYIFLHRLLQEYLASLDIQSAPAQLREHARGVQHPS